MGYRLKVKASGKESGILVLDLTEGMCAFTYVADNPISIVMPPERTLYTNTEKFSLLPVFDQFVPEGWLYEIFKNYLSKKINRHVKDFDIFYQLAPNIEGFLTFETDEKKSASKKTPAFHLNEIIKNDTSELFRELVSAFLLRSAVSGVQPKISASLSEGAGKAGVKTTDVVIKTWTSTFPQLSLNEFLCLKAAEEAGLEVPKRWLSENGRFLIVERFDRKDGNYLGFEEFCSIAGKTRKDKYTGSYEKIAKALSKLTNGNREELKKLFKRIVLSYLLKDGDAHLKNFGVLYSHPYAGDVRLAPVYDIVCTVIYLPDDTPALPLFGKKVWHSKDKLIEFGVSYCSLSAEEAREAFQEVVDAVAKVRSFALEYKDAFAGSKEFVNSFLGVIESSLALACQTVKRFRYCPINHRPQRGNRSGL